MTDKLSISNFLEKASQNAKDRHRASRARPAWSCQAALRARCNLIGQLELLGCLTGVSKALVAHGARQEWMDYCYKDALSHRLFIHFSYHSLSVFTHSFSSRCLPVPRVHCSCSPTFQNTITGISQLSCTQQECLWLQRESSPSWTLLTCVAACKSVQHGTIRSPLLQDSWTKSLPTAGSARWMLKTIMHLRSIRRSLCFPLRDNHLLPSPPTLWRKSRTKRRVQLSFHSSTLSLYGMRVVAVEEWVPARDQDSLRTSVAQKRTRRGCAGCEPSS